jgi:hypothetical protein
LTDRDGGVTKQTEKDRLFAPAIILFGKGWQSKLQRASGYSQGRLQQVYRNESQAVTSRLENTLLRTYRRELVRRAAGRPRHGRHYQDCRRKAVMPPPARMRQSRDYWRLRSTKTSRKRV